MAKKLQIVKRVGDYETLSKQKHNSIKNDYIKTLI